MKLERLAKLLREDITMANAPITVADYALHRMNAVGDMAITARDLRNERAMRYLKAFGDVGERAYVNQAQRWETSPHDLPFADIIPILNRTVEIGFRDTGKGDLVENQPAVEVLVHEDEPLTMSELESAFARFLEIAQDAEY